MRYQRWLHWPLGLGLSFGAIILSGCGDSPAPLISRAEVVDASTALIAGEPLPLPETPFRTFPADVEEIELAVAIPRDLPNSLIPSAYLAVVARGSLPDGCTQIGQPQVRRRSGRFFVYLPAIQPIGVRCTPPPVEGFETLINLGPIQSGQTYSVRVNQVVARQRL